MTEEYAEKIGLFEDLGDEIEPLTEEEIEELFKKYEEVK
jgi:hypothetical protein